MNKRVNADKFIADNGYVTIMQQDGWEILEKTVCTAHQAEIAEVILERLEELYNEL